MKIDIENMTIKEIRELQKLIGSFVQQPVQSQPTTTEVECGTKIVILQRGWICVGRYIKSGDERKLEGASVIRVWGTTKGLGEIAEGGPTNSTKLDPAGTVRFHPLAEVAALDCNAEKWSKYVD
jgi:hypothetical protein